MLQLNPRNQIVRNAIAGIISVNFVWSKGSIGCFNLVVNCVHFWQK